MNISTDIDFREDQAKALASAARLRILEWLKSPETCFAHQETGAPEKIGVCVTLITERLGMSQPTVSRHLDRLRRAGFVTVNPVGRWSFYMRNEAGLDEYRRWLDDTL